MKFDDILEKQAGEFGPYQKRIYVLVCLPAVAAAFVNMLPVFILATPKHRCHLPGLANDTFDIQSDQHMQLINASVPWTQREMSSCELYNYGNDTMESQEVPNHLPLNNHNRVPKKQCDKWVYDSSEHISAVNDFNMVCKDSILKSHFVMMTFIGNFVGAFLTGTLSDLFGRKLVFISCLLVIMAVTAIQLISPFYWIFLATRLIQGLAASGVFNVSFVYVVELVGPNYRMFAGIIITLFWCAGILILVGAAYWIRYWKYLVATTTVPFLLFLSYIWIIPESPRWLMSAGKLKQADKILQKIAKSNKRQIPSKLLHVVAEEEREAKRKTESAKVWRLFTHKVLFVRTVVVAFNRFVLDLTYFGISLNVEHLSGNLYVNYTLSSTVEAASVIFVLLLILRCGRKPLFSGNMLLAATGFLLSTLPIFFGGQKDKIYSVGLVMLGKFGVSGAYTTNFVYCSEIFPTSVRSSAMALMYVVGVAGGIVSPYIVEMSEPMGERMSAAFPMLVFGGAALAAGLSSMVLPETKNKVLPESIEDAIKYETHADTPIDTDSSAF